MMNSRAFLGIALILSVGSFASSGRAQSNGEVVAEVNGNKLTRAELEQKEAAKLLQARYKLYLVERDALDQLIDDRLLEEQARRENVSVEELLNRHVRSQVKEPTEDQLEVYYEGLQTEESLPTVHDKILGSIRQIRLAKARSTYLKSLRSQASILVALGPPNAEVPPGDAPRRGPANARVVVVEFADYQCPYCRRIHPELKKLQDEFGDQLVLVFKDFPLPMHPHAEKAAEAARCAGEQGKFWDFHDLLFDHSSDLEVPQLKEHARALKLDAARFDKCLDSGEEASGVEKDREQAQSLGITGTPSFFINGHFLSGAVDYVTLRQIVEQQLAVSTSTLQAVRK